MAGSPSDKLDDLVQKLDRPRASASCYSAVDGGAPAEIHRLQRWR